jgi:hypothetical protein
MSPKEKACDIVGAFYKSLSINPENDKWKAAKQCALIAVEEIIQEVQLFGYAPTFYDHPETGVVKNNILEPAETYWQSVKTEIEKL